MIGLNDADPGAGISRRRVPGAGGHAGRFRFEGDAEVFGDGQAGGAGGIDLRIEWRARGVAFAAALVAGLGSFTIAVGEEVVEQDDDLFASPDLIAQKFGGDDHVLFGLMNEPKQPQPRKRVTCESWRTVL